MKRKTHASISAIERPGGLAILRKIEIQLEEPVYASPAEIAEFVLSVRTAAKDFFGQLAGTKEPKR